MENVSLFSSIDIPTKGKIALIMSPILINNIFVFSKRTQLYLLGSFNIEVKISIYLGLEYQPKKNIVFFNTT